MLTRARLLDLYHSLRATRVLSVYIDGSAADPAARRSWRLQLDHELEKLNQSLDTSLPGGRERFERCVDLLNAALAGVDPLVGSLGWAAFVTAEGVHTQEALPAPTPTIAEWRTGPCLAPGIRATKESRPVVIAVADARQATVYVYRPGKLERAETIHAHHPIEHPLHMGSPPRAGFHGGTRGAAGHDMAQRALLTGRDRMLADTVERIGVLADGSAWIVLGGIKRVTAHLERELAPIAPHRVLAHATLDVHASEAEIAEAARVGAAALRDASDARRIGEIADEAGAHGLGVIGRTATKHALEQACVRDLYLTDRFLDDRAHDAESAVRAAFDQDATVEWASGPAAAALDQYGGIAAGLRFRPTPGMDEALPLAETTSNNSSESVVDAPVSAPRIMRRDVASRRSIV